MESDQTARVIQVHKERYILSVDNEILEGDLTGKFMFEHESAETYPAVGDFVQISKFDSNQAIIHSVCERKSVLRRKSVSKASESQLIASNIDVAFIVSAVDRDFNLHRIERYLTLIYDGHITPILVLNKIDLISKSELETILSEVKQRHSNLQIITSSGLSEDGIKPIKKIMVAGKIYCFIGSSGVGKSTLINQLLHEHHFETQEISASNSKGRHTTTHRELIELNSGAIVIDTPGMKEIGLSTDESALAETFADIDQLKKQCKFSNCSHQNEPGCAILKAIEAGDLDEDKFKNYQKLQRETARFQIDKREKRQKDKQQSKLYKSIQDANRKNKSI